MAIGHVSRRSVLLGGGLLVAGWIAYSRTQPSGETLSVTDAFEAARDKQIFLIDIRRPDEWAKTGIGEGASPIDMRREDFIAELDQLTGGDRSAAIALICARGVRSRHLSNRLRDAGYQRIIDVPEGMLGSFSGPGWLKVGLPVIAYDV
ncbi:MAG: rhodanese-like domain-containing protein [Pseudomonadota bacterium]